jgi:hypothetical protein
MRNGLLLSIGSLVLVIALTSLERVPVAGQTTASQTKNVSKTAVPKNWKPPRTSWGDPDLQGQWNSQTSTPMERPLTGPLAGKETLSDEEAENLEEQNRKSIDSAPDKGDPGTYNAFWRDSGNALSRTSWIRRMEEFPR